jgi:D-3-phosphoglycerate dehydrogenase
MPASTTVKRVFWFDDHKTPNVADVLAKEADFAVHRLAFNGPEDKNWAVMAACHAYCMTSARDEVPDQYKGTPALIERCQELLVISTSGAMWWRARTPAFSWSTRRALMLRRSPSMWSR